MVFRRFYFNILTRVLLLAASLTLLIYLIYRTELYATILIITVILVFQVVGLIHYADKTNRDLTRFLDSVKHSDFSQSFTAAGLGRSFDELKTAFAAVTEQFRRARAEKEEHFRYLQTVVQHVGVGLLAFDGEGKIELMNTTAKRLLKSPHPRFVQDLGSVSTILAEQIGALRSGDKALVKAEIDDESLQLVCYATEFKLRDKLFTLVSIQNIRSELEEKEMEAWQNLIRVLTHEIMNSITPIASLAATVNDLVAQTQHENDNLQGETVDDVRGALQTIQRRSEGLLHFVQSYRNLTRIPKPKFEIFPVDELFKQIDLLMRSQFAENGADFQHEVMPASLMLTADQELAEQILINLLTNALQAVKEQAGAKVRLTAKMDDRSRVLMQVIDNGPGILPEVLDKIFIPFYTTKKGGSGIGLSLSRQIMRLHGGSISAHSVPNAETVFSLRF